VATTSRPQDPDVAHASVISAWEDIASRLHREPFCFRFFQAVWMLERMQPDRGPVGEFRDPKQEAVHFGTHASLAFPASEIQDMNWDVSPPRMNVNFLGLQGLSGVLPHVYTELLEERARARDLTMREFFDTLNNRFIALFYRAWKRYRFPVDGSRFRSSLLSLVGLGTDGLENRLQIPDDAVVFYAGLLGLQPRSAVALEQVLSDYFQVPAQVDQFVGSWYTLGGDSTCRFMETDTASEQLGLGVVVGDEVWDQQSRARIRLGPLTRKQYEWFLPGQTGHERLRDVTRFFARDQIDFEVQLVLRKQDVPGCRFEDTDRVQLGWTTWMKTRPHYPRHADDAILDLRAT
jgi:type VI secretion system protein ImpH